VVAADVVAGVFVVAGRAAVVAKAERRRKRDRV
jgi:hypothetical protein